MRGDRSFRGLLCVTLVSKSDESVSLKDSSPQGGRFVWAIHELIMEMLIEFAFLRFMEAPENIGITKR